MASRRPRFLRFGRSDYRGLATAVRYLLIAGWQVYVLRKDLSRWLRSETGNSGEEVQLRLSDFSRAAAQYVDIASRHPFRWARCLQRSLALCLWLYARGFRPVLKIGVRKEGAKLKAHAWVEEGGRIINDAAEVQVQFAPLPALGRELAPTGRGRGPAGSNLE
jgi:hypothetical protein